MADDLYREAGVDATQEERGIEGLLHFVRQTFAYGSRPVRLEIGYFATIVEVAPGRGLALTIDGVGTKILVAQMLHRYDTIGIDCVAMNVNDLLCVGAEPICMVDYIALEHPDPELLTAIGKGLAEGARQAGISIPGGEIAQLKEMLRGVREGYAFDLAGAGIGLVDLHRVIVGQDLEQGDLLLGLASSGIHSNGLTLAREVLFRRAKLRPEQYLDDLQRSVGEELLEPTRIYVKPILTLLRSGLRVKALFHITGDGLFNLVRTRKGIGYVLEHLPEPPPIFALIQRLGQIAETEMYRVFNMGIGFCVVVPEGERRQVSDLLKQEGIACYPLGYVAEDPERKILIPPKGMVGQNGRFAPL